MTNKQHTGVAVVVVVMTISEGALKALLVRRESERWGLPAGTPAAHEPLLAAAERVIKEQAGFTVDYLEQLYTFGDRVPTDDTPRIIEIAYFGLVPSVLLRSDKLANREAVNWFAEGAYPQLLDGRAEILRVASDRLRGKLAYSAVGFELLPDQFTLAELQNLYEVILGKSLDKRNFRKKIIELGVLEPTGEERVPRHGRGRPATLFRFKPEVFRSIEMKGDIFQF